MMLLAGQLAQEMSPIALLNVSSGHALHTSADPSKPATQPHCGLPVSETLFAGHVRHSELFVPASVAENVLLGQAVHGTLPGTALYVPVGHFSQKSGHTFVSTSVPCTCISRITTSLSTELRTYKYCPVSGVAHSMVAQVLFMLCVDMVAQIRLPVLVVTSPTCTYSMSVLELPSSALTARTVTRRPKSTRHHWLLPDVVIDAVSLLLSFAKIAGFRKS